MKIAISIYGYFNLSHKAAMLYAELAGIKLYPFVVERRLDSRYVDYVPGLHATAAVYYSTKPLENGLCADDDWFECEKISRDDPNLITVIEMLGESANTGYNVLKVVEIPDGVEWKIFSGDESAEIIIEKGHWWS